MGAATEAISASHALQANNQIVTELRGVLQAFQIVKGDVQTERFDVSAQYKPVQGSTHARELTGYHVNHLFRVKLPTPDQLGQLLDALIDAGSNVLHGIRFSVGSPSALIDKARELAVNDAHRKAGQLAEVGEVKLGRVVMMVEGAGKATIPMRQGAMDLRAMSAVPVAVGEQSFSVNVTVTYAIE